MLDADCVVLFNKLYSDCVLIAPKCILKNPCILFLPSIDKTFSAVFHYTKTSKNRGANM